MYQYETSVFYIIFRGRYIIPMSENFQTQNLKNK